jgi:hypothetical protein
MSAKMFVKPARAGDIIRDPHTLRVLPDEGGRVPDNTFWRRRLNKGEVVEVPKQEPAQQRASMASRKTEEP